MNLKKAIIEIVKNWEELQKSQTEKEIGWTHPKSTAVWCAKSDTAGSYEVDEEWIGVSPQGNIIWAYASGCSCWAGDYDEDKKPTVKEFTLKHQHAPEEWERAIIKFVETKVLQELPNQNHGY